MKIKLLALVAITSVSSIFVYQNFNSNPNIKVSKYSARVSEQSSTEHSAAGAAEYLASIRGDVKTGIVDPILVKKAQDQIANIASRASNIGLQFEFMGPGNMGGRTRGIVVDNQDTNTLFAASVTGGVYISTNGGNVWTRSWLDKNGNAIRTNNLSCLTQTANGYLYAGTGSRFEDGAGPTKGGKGGAPKGEGQGIYMSTDGGASWSLLESTTPANSSSFGQVNYIVGHPSNAKEIIAATSGGFQVSIDGGATWKRDVICNGAGLPVSNCITVDYNSDGTRINAGFSNGDHYSGTAYTASCGLKTAVKVGNGGGNRWLVSSSPSKPLKAYALISNGGSYIDIKVTLDGGQKWNSINPPMPVSAVNFDLFGNNGGGQAWYDMLFKAVPNPDAPSIDKLFVGGVQLWRFDGNWTQAAVPARSGATPGPYNMHVDHHSITYDKNNPENIYFGNDGGVYKSLDGGYTFFDINKGYSTLQYYAIAHANYDYVVGGAQDNGSPYVTPFRPGNPTYGVPVYNTGVLNGDGFDAAVSQIVDLKYVSSQYGNMGRGSITSAQGSGACDPYCGMGNFYTNLKLWENENDLTSKDSILFVVDTSEVNIGLGTGSRRTFEGTVTSDQAAAQIIVGSIRIGTSNNQLIYDGNGGFTGNGKGTLDEKTLKFSITLNVAPPLNARINTYATANYPAGSIITVPSTSQDIPINYIVNTNLNPGDRIKIQDPIQSLIALQVNQKCSLNANGTQYNCDNPCYPINGQTQPSSCGTPSPGKQQPGIAIARRGIALGTNPNWMHLAVGSVTEFEFSPNGDELYYNPGNNGSVRMVKGLNEYYSPEDIPATLAPKSIFAGSGNVTSINFNPQNADEMLITTGNYGSVNHVYLLTRTPGTDLFTTTIIQGNLPDMPVYDAIFDAGNPKRVIIATDQGVFSSNDITSGSVEWSAEDFGKIPVFDIDQQILDHTKASNFGMIYLGTHGNGIWKSGTITSVEEISHKEFSDAWESNITVYPNPLHNSGQLQLTVTNPEKASIHIYSINGQLQKTIKPNLIEGDNDIAFDVSNLQYGTYFITLIDGETQKVAKFIKM